MRQETSTCNTDAMYHREGFVCVGMQDPTGYKWELIQRPDHKKDPILHVRAPAPINTVCSLVGRGRQAGRHLPA